ncbi:MAG: hypothetical protein PHC52_09280 [Syntrophales bacterium]|nr:hypothetical protein [Syntrophales bacterium]
MKRDIIFLAVLYLFSSAMAIPARAVQRAGDAGSAEGNRALAGFGSAEGIRDNLAAPIAGGAAMKTLDGSASFNAQVICPASIRYMEVTAQPAAGGDLSTVVISQDTNLDGAVDYSYTVPFSVSGICGNGLISCTGGTWEDCTYYGWTADARGRISLEESSISRLGGCYCINSSCGLNLFWRNAGSILKDIGGGAASAVQAVSPGYAITDARIEGTVIAYYGQDTSRCSQIPGNSGSSFPERFYSGGTSDGYLLEAKEAEFASQEGNPDSYYNLITRSSAAQNTQGDYASCNIVRNMTVQTLTDCPVAESRFMDTIRKCIITADGYTPRVISTGRGGGGCYFSASISPAGGDALYIGNHLCGDPSGGIVKNARIIITCGGVQKIIYTAEYKTAQFPECASNNQNFVQGYYYTASSNSIDCSHYAGALPVNGDTCALDPEQRDVLTETADNQCAAYESDPKCRLKEEKTDSVFTVKNFSPTALIPLSTCRNYAGIESHTVCGDWWKKERVYLCERSRPFDFSDAKKRVDSIYASAGESSGTMTFTDKRKTGNTWAEEGRSLQLGWASSATADKCDKACKTRRPAANASAGTSGTAADYRKSIESQEYFYRKCVSGMCPAEAGEEIVKACRCITEFAEAASIMSALDAAGRDLICSTGVKH